MVSPRINRIQQLSPALIGQIAAGEVVERPASVLKELLENSLDAGASSIIIQVAGAGLSMLQVTDNGHGILKEDLHLALQSHATSKIALFDDLNQLGSFGFRGEALASIAAVSHLTLTSCSRGQEEAWQVVVEGARQTPHLAPAAHPQGTTVLVEDLFCQTPVRRKFLKSPKTELFHIEDIIKRFALAHPNCAFQYFNEGKAILQFPIVSEMAQQRRRLGRCFGQIWANAALYFEQKATDIQLKSWLAPPQLAKRYGYWQYFYVNGRIVKDPKLTHIIRSLFPEEINAGLSPCYAIFLELPAEEVDVNVHPTKQEVRFHNPQWVYDFMIHTITDSRQRLLSRQSSRDSMLPVKTSAPLFAMHKQSLYQKNIEKEDQQIASSPLLLTSSSRYVWTNCNQMLFCIDLEIALQAWWKKKILSNTTSDYQQAYLLPKEYAIHIDWSDYKLLLDQLGFMIFTDKRGTILQRVPIFFAQANMEIIFPALHTQLKKGFDHAVEYLINLIQPTCFFNLPQLFQQRIILELCQNPSLGVVSMTDQLATYLFELQTMQEEVS